jgi:hypothetical protein
MGSILTKIGNKLKLEDKLELDLMFYPVELDFCDLTSSLLS